MRRRKGVTMRCSLSIRRLGTTTTCAHLTAAVSSSLFCAVRCLSDAVSKEALQSNIALAATGAASTAVTTATAAAESKPSALASLTPAPADLITRANSPRYTSHRDAERLAYVQEDKVQHRSFGGEHEHEHHDCGCPPKHEDVNAEVDAFAAVGGAAASSVMPAERRNFGAVFHQEVAAWRASRRHHDDVATSAAPAATAKTDPAPCPMGKAETPRGASTTPPLPQQHHPSWQHVRLEDVPPGISYDAYVKHLQAEEESARFLAQNTMHSIRRSLAREDAAANADAVMATHCATWNATNAPRGHRGVQTLLDYNKQWAAEVSRFNPRYFVELAKEQKPEYLWIGCSDSRVPANEVVGLHPGDVFVHRNIGNIFSLSDLNCLSALQFAVDCLKVQHVIIAGHYKCGGVTAAMKGNNLGLTDHWIMQVADIKNKWWDRVVSNIAETQHLNVLCELNVLEQLNHVANCRVVQRKWKAQNANDRYAGLGTSGVYVRPEYATKHAAEMQMRRHAPSTALKAEEELEVHGWVYSLDDGILRPLLSLSRHSNVKREMTDAIEAVFIRYAQLH